MATKKDTQSNLSAEPSKPDEGKNPAEKMISTSSDPAPGIPEEVSAIHVQNEQLAQLQQLVKSLGDQVTGMKKSLEREAMFQRAVQSVETAANAVAAAPTGIPIEQRPGRPAEKECDCDDACPECQCNSSKCCCFNIMLHRIQVASLGGPAGLFDEGGTQLELQIYASIPGIGGVLYPSLGGHVMVQGKLIGPGAWVCANVLIAKVCIPKGQSKTIKIDFEVKESDKFLKDDIGSGFKNITLNCCCNDMNVLEHKVQLTQGGGGQAVIGMELYAQKVC